MTTNASGWVVRLTLANGKVDEVGAFDCQEAAEVFAIRVKGNRHVTSAVVLWRD